MLLIFFIHLLFISATADLGSDHFALLSLRSALRGKTLKWNETATTPCNWSEVVCENDRVTSLLLPSFDLSGPIPPNTISNLTFLRTLSLRFNNLFGLLPSDLSQLSHLRSLYLQGNHFSGPLPDSISSMQSLVRLNLASNSFSGQIPASYAKLTGLRTLFLDHNNFDGVLPDFELPNIQEFNVSYNPLIHGPVPVSLQDIHKNAFSGTSICGKPLDNACGNHVD